MTPRLALALLTLATWFAGCGDDHDHPHEPAKRETKAEGDGGHVHAEHTPLGAVDVDGYHVEVVRVAPVVPGELADFDLDFGKGARPETVRCWIGLETGIGSRKERFTKEGETVMHGHPEVPNPLPEGSALWIEIEVGGKPQRASIPFSKS